MTNPKAHGDSAEQREAETEMLAALSFDLGVEFKPQRFKIEKTWLQVDGVSKEPPILCEAFAHHGALKSAQTRKVIADAFKLLFVERLHKGSARKILLFADEQAAACCRGGSWYSAAFNELGVEVRVVAVTPEMREKVRAAQTRQYR